MQPPSRPSPVTPRTAQIQSPVNRIFWERSRSFELTRHELPSIVPFNLGIEGDEGCVKWMATHLDQLHASWNVSSQHVKDCIIPRPSAR